MGVVQLAFYLLWRTGFFHVLAVVMSFGLLAYVGMALVRAVLL